VYSAYKMLVPTSQRTQFFSISILNVLEESHQKYKDTMGNVAFVDAAAGDVN
jgi:hypothetical protein